MDDLRRLKAFVRVAERSSFTAAARELGLTQPQVSRAIREVERAMQCTLFSRSTRRVALTPEGQRYLKGVRRALEALDDASDAVRAESGMIRGVVRVTAPFALGNLLASVLLELTRAHPELSIDVVLADRIVGLLDENFDVAIRVGRLPPSELKVRSLGTNLTILCAAPAYLRQHPSPRRPSELTEHEHVLFSVRPEPERLTLVDRKLREVRVKIAGRVRVNELGLALAAAIHGAGIASLPEALAAPALAAGTLTRLLPGWTLRPSRIHVVCPPRSPQPARVTAFIAALETVFSARRGAATRRD
jgi:DNA-binding transcriptional LysR family regulator